MIHPETCVQIRRYFYAEHWKIGTIARELGVHPDTVHQAVESNRFRRAVPRRPSITDPYLEFVRQTLDQHPRLTATRIYQMIRERGYTASVVQLRRAVARLRPVRAGNQKGRVERAIRYVRDSFWAGRSFTTLAGCNRQALLWRDQVAPQRPWPGDMPSPPIWSFRSAHPKRFTFASTSTITRSRPRPWADR